MKQSPPRIEKRGRPTTDPKPIVLGFRMGPTDVQRLDAVAKHRKADRSATIRALISEEHERIQTKK